MFFKNLYLPIFFLFVLSITLKANPILDAAFAAVNDGKFKKAEFLFNQALKQGINPAIVEYNLGYIYFRQNEIGKCITAYKSVISQAPYFKNTYHNLARVYYQMQEYSMAIDILEAYVTKVSNDYDTHLLLGDIYSKLLIYEAAERNYTSAVLLTPELADGYIALAEMYVTLDDGQRALQSIKEGLVFDPTNIILMEKEGDFLLYLGQYLEAAVIYDKILISFTNLTVEEKYKYSYQLANAYVDGEYYYMAIKELEGIIEAFPEETDPIDLMGFILFSTKRLNAAFDFYKKVFITKKKIGYLGIRDVFARAINEENKELIQQLVDFYKEQNLKDELLRNVQNG